MSLAPKVFGLTSFLVGAVAIATSSDVRLPGNDRGYTPAQPIAFSHRVHAGDLSIDCLFCHPGAEESRHAGVPAASVCMKCHAHVTAGYDAQLEERASAEAEEREPRRVVSPELAKLYDALALDDELRPIEGREPRPIEWVRVHQVPDFVYFDHSVHVARDVACQTCHGPVQSMERVRQESDLSMGWCVSCHRQSRPDASGPDAWRDHASTDCVTCHF